MAARGRRNAGENGQTRGGTIGPGAGQEAQRVETRRPRRSGANEARGREGRGWSPVPSYAGLSKRGRRSRSPGAGQDPKGVAAEEELMSRNESHRKGNHAAPRRNG